MSGDATGIAVSSTTSFTENTDETGTAWTTVVKMITLTQHQQGYLFHFNFQYHKPIAITCFTPYLIYHEVKVKISFENLINLARQGVDLFKSAGPDV